LSCWDWKSWIVVNVCVGVEEQEVRSKEKSKTIKSFFLGKAAHQSFDSK